MIKLKEFMKLRISEDILYSTCPHILSWYIPRVYPHEDHRNFVTL